jgi:C_GCAxxG_C_C family probable redox protein
MSKADEAVATFKSGCNCSQAVLSAFSEELGLDKMTVLKIASGFGGGIGHMGQTCGAVTGAVMVISLKSGLSLEKTHWSNQKVYDIIGHMADEFKKRNRSIMCKDLLGVDFSDAEAYRAARQKDVFYTVCPKFVSDAVQIVEEFYK